MKREYFQLTSIPCVRESQLPVSDDGVRWVRSVREAGRQRLGRGKTWADSAMSHELDLKGRGGKVEDRDVDGGGST